MPKVTSKLKQREYKFIICNDQTSGSPNGSSDNLAFIMLPPSQNNINAVFAEASIS